MKLFFLAALSVIVSSCAHQIKRQAHVLPVFEGSLLYSADPKFISARDPVAYLTPELKRQPASSVSRMSDGSFLITWTSTEKKREKLIFLDSGLHPVQVPDKAIKQTRNLDEEIQVGDPFLLTGFGPDTAYVRDFLDLRPIPKGKLDKVRSPAIPR
jgi:hypothetical protein